MTRRRGLVVAGHTFVIVKLGTEPTIVPLMSWVNQYPLEDFIDRLIAGNIASGTRPNQPVCGRGIVHN